MKWKVAVASSDGKVINQHFGRSKEFLIFEIEDQSFQFLELRRNTPPCGFGEHHEDAMDKTVDLLSDCKVVLVSQIGPGADTVLKRKGIQAFVVPILIEEAINKIIRLQKIL